MTYLAMSPGFPRPDIDRQPSFSPFSENLGIKAVDGAHPRRYALEARAMMLTVAGQMLAQMNHLMRAHRQEPTLAQTVLDQQLGEEMRLARSPPAIGALVARRRKQRQEDPWRIN